MTEAHRPHTPYQRVTANTLALATLEALQKGQALSAHDAQILRSYTGRGSLESGGPGHALAAINEYYTPSGLANAVWSLLHGLMLEKDAPVRYQLILEPSAGAGRFIDAGMAFVQPAQITAVEIDATASAILRALYPSLRVVTSPFEGFSKEETYHVAIGNPPFGPRGASTLSDKRWIDEYPMYFLEAALDRLESGGLLAMIVPSSIGSGIRHAGNRAVLMARARLRIAVRLPFGAFSDASARLETDLLILEKRPREVGDLLAELARAHGAIAVAASRAIQGDEAAFLKGQYFEMRPEHLSAPMVTETRYGKLVCDTDDVESAWQRIAGMKAITPTPAPGSYAQLEAALNASQWAAGRTAELLQSALKALQTRGAPIPHGAIRTLKDGSDERFTIALSGSNLTQSWKPAPREALIIRDAKLLSQQLETFLEARRERMDNPEAADDARLTARDASAAFVERHGSPHSSPEFKAVLGALPRLHLVSGAILKDGQLNPDLNTPLKASFETTNDPDEAIAHLLEYQMLTEEALAKKLGISPGAALELLLASPLALTIQGKWEHWNRYAGHNPHAVAALTRRQSEHASEPVRSRLNQQAQTLEESAPWQTLEQFELTGREGFVPPEFIQMWANETFPAVALHGTHGTWSAFAHEASDKRSGVTKANATKHAKQLERFLNFEHVAGSVQGASGMSESAYLGARKNALDIALEGEARLKASFKSFVATDPDMREEIEKRYNSLYTSAAPLEPERRMKLPIWDGPEPHDYQWREASLRLERGQGLTAFGTGLGKTITAAMILEGMLAGGHASRVMITAPKNLMTKHTREIAQALPHRRIVTIGISSGPDGFTDDSPATVREKLGKLSFGAYDAAILSHDTYRRLQIGEQTLKALMTEEASDAALDNTTNSERNATAYSLARDLAHIEGDLAERMDGHHPIEGITFEQLGIDALICDEAGVYRNLYPAPEYYGKRLAFMGAGGDSNRAIDHFLKCEIISQTHHARTPWIFELTATPTDNSPLELYSLLKPMARKAFTDIGIHGPEGFVDRYCEVESVIYPDFAGNLTVRPGVVAFKNLDELRGLIGRYITHATAASVGLKVPALEISEHLFAMSPQQQKSYEYLRRQANELLESKDFNKGAGVLRIFGAMRGLALDPAFHTQDPYTYNPRFAAAAYLANEAVKKGGKVLIFLDWVTPSERDDHGLATGKKLAGPDAFDRLAEELVGLGISPQRIAMVTADRAPGVKRQQISDEYNAGLYDVLLATRGSMGMGGDLQHGTTDIIHADVPPSPGVWDQTNGRGVRQGNTNEAVRVHVLLAKGTLDGLLYTIMRGKSSWRDQLFHSSENATRNSEMLTYDDMLTALAPDPEQARRDIERLRLDIAQSSDDARVKSELRDLSVYLQTYVNQLAGETRAKGRKKGPTENDAKVKASLNKQLERLKREISAKTGQLYATALEHGGFLCDQRVLTIGDTVQLKGRKQPMTISAWEYTRTEGLLARFANSRQAYPVRQLEPHVPAVLDITITA